MDSLMRITNWYIHFDMRWKKETMPITCMNIFKHSAYLCTNFEILENC